MLTTIINYFNLVSVYSLTKNFDMEFTKKQLEIIGISIELISDLGIQGFTIKNLSKRVGVTEGAIYRHFESKTEILYSILLMFQKESAVTLKTACSSDKSAMDEIANIFAHHFNYFSNRPAVAAVIFSESIFQNNNLLSQEVFKLLKMHEDALSCIITKGQQTGEIRNGSIIKEQLVRMIIGSIRYTVTKWRLSHYSFDIQKEGEVLLQNLKELMST